MNNSAASVNGAPPDHAIIGELLAFYQPIVSLETRSIAGYETLGRQSDRGTIKSLGPFFTDTRVPVSEHVRIDRLLREQAIRKLGETEDPPMLFINLKPSWIYEQYVMTGELHTIRLLKKYGIDPARICIEITEEEFQGPMPELNEIIDIYRANGCRIAIDDVGSGFSNFDRIAQIQPNLLKIDIHLMKKSATHDGYLGALRSFSTLAEQVGASLLVEGVETRDDFKRAIGIGARYIQGFLFSAAVPDFYPRDTFRAMIEEELRDNRVRLRETTAHWNEVGNRLTETARNAGIETMLTEHADAAATEFRLPADRADELDDTIRALLPNLDEECIRVYLCSGAGIQLSSNIVRRRLGEWTNEKQYRNADWSWRPYFIQHLSYAKSGTEAMLSPRYSDLETRSWIRTISVPVGGDFLLLIDRIDDG